MRRCLNEALVVAKHRTVFGKRMIDIPLQRRQLMKLMLHTEQAMSMFVHAADAMDKAARGDEQAKLVQRILTPLLKFRSCRDNIQVATGAMEVRGGNGYIENSSTHAWYGMPISASCGKAQAILTPSMSCSARSPRNKHILLWWLPLNSGLRSLPACLLTTVECCWAICAALPVI